MHCLVAFFGVSLLSVFSNLFKANYYYDLQFRITDRLLFFHLSIYFTVFGQANIVVLITHCGAV